MTTAPRNVAYREAFRALLSTLTKASTGVTNLALTPSGYTRSSGSFINDGFSRGDELVVTGFPAAYSGIRYADEVTDTLLIPRNFAGVTLAAAGARQLQAVLPSGGKYEGWQFEPQELQPWFRESFKPMSADRRSLGPKALVRDDGLWLIDFFYPINIGTAGLDGMVDSFLELFYPGRQLLYSGQAVTIRSSCRRGTVEDPAWIMAPTEVRFFANSFNPQ